jgi:hypothetical protein
LPARWLANRRAAPAHGQYPPARWLAIRSAIRRTAAAHGQRPPARWRAVRRAARAAARFLYFGYFGYFGAERPQAADRRLNVLRHRYVADLARPVREGRAYQHPVRDAL